ncbi:MAG: hypothetical protein JO325_24340 [Solirubrobacterales bacterium]|nr:hypothetical protein [Solirubrobacterales bacterium]
MKVNVVRDENGKVVATFEAAVEGAPSVAPVLETGHTVHAVEAEADYRRDLTVFYNAHSRS